MPLKIIAQALHLLADQAQPYIADQVHRLAVQLVGAVEHEAAHILESTGLPQAYAEGYRAGWDAHGAMADYDPTPPPHLMQAPAQTEPATSSTPPPGGAADNMSAPATDATVSGDSGVKPGAPDTPAAGGAPADEGP